MTQFPPQGVVELVANGPRELPPGGRLDAALRSARLAEAAHFEALMNIRDAATLRLQVLKDDLEPVVEARREADTFIDLALVPGSPPRLWIDMVSYVLMAPTRAPTGSARTPRRSKSAVRDRRAGRDGGQDHRLHRPPGHRSPAPSCRTGQRNLACGASGPWHGALLLAWLSGFSLGALAFFLVAAWLDKLP
jgi:hypothetical protein